MLAGGQLGQLDGMHALMKVNGHAERVQLAIVYM